MSDPQPTRDPRLEIPEVLRTPVKKPDLPTGNGGPPIAGLGEVGRSLAIGIDFLCMIGAGALLGWLADRGLKIAPWGMLLGLLLGFLIGTFRLLKRLNK